jgi:hypothetical protein
MCAPLDTQYLASSFLLDKSYEKAMKTYRKKTREKMNLLLSKSENYEVADSEKEYGFELVFFSYDNLTSRGLDYPMERSISV